MFKKNLGTCTQVLIKKFAIAIADNQFSVMLFLLVFEIFIGYVRSALLIVNIFQIISYHFFLTIVI